MNRPCPITITQCPGGDNPTLNTSSEAPDPLIFTGIGFTQYNPYSPPPLDTNGQNIQQSCYGTATSEVSQSLADLIAAAASEACASGLGGIVGGTAGGVGSTNSGAGGGAAGVGAGGGGGGGGAGAGGSKSGIPPTGQDSIKPLNPFLCIEVTPTTPATYVVTGPDSRADWTFSGAPPAGMAFSKVRNNACQLTGTPTTAGTFPFVLTATLTQNSALTIQCNDTLNVIGISDFPIQPDSNSHTGYSVTLPPASANVPFSDELSATGGRGAITFTADPDYPPPYWVTIASDGTISGTPPSSAAGTANYFDVDMKDSGGHICIQTVNLPVKCSVFCSSGQTPCPPNGTVCQPYTCEFSCSVSGATFSGTVPDGLSISSSGFVTGCPLTPGPGNFDITATLPNGQTCQGSFSCTMAAIPGDSVAKSPASMLWTTSGATIQGSGFVSSSLNGAGGSVTFICNGNQLPGNALGSVAQSWSSAINSCLGSLCPAQTYDVSVKYSWSPSSNSPNPNGSAISQLNWNFAGASGDATQTSYLFTNVPVSQSPATSTAGVAMKITGQGTLTFTISITPHQH